MSNNDELTAWLSWVSENLLMDQMKSVDIEKKNMLTKFVCTDKGERKEYLGCKVEQN